MAATKKPVPNNRAVVTRQDVLDAVGDLRNDLLSPQNPLSLYSFINSEIRVFKDSLQEHVRAVAVIAERQTAIADELTAHKQQYAGDKGRIIGWAGGLSAAASALVKLLFPSRL